MIYKYNSNCPICNQSNSCGVKSSMIRFCFTCNVIYLVTIEEIKIAAQPTKQTPKITKS